MTQLLKANSEFPFSKLSFHKPINILGDHNQYMIRTYLKDDTNSTIFFQTPSCLLKDGLLIQPKKKTVDFLFPDNNAFLNWLEKIEEICKKELLDQQTEWFQSDFSNEDIETLFLSSYKPYKGHKNYYVRTNIPITKNLKIYNEKKEEILFSESFNTNEKVIAVIEFVGIRCSPRNFNLEFEVKQLMVLKEYPLFDSCIISTPDVHEENLLELDLNNLNNDYTETITLKTKKELEENSKTENNECLEQKENLEENSKTENFEELEQKENFEELKQKELEELKQKELEELKQKELEELKQKELEELKQKELEELKQKELENAFQKAKEARYLGIVTFLKSKNYSFNMEKIVLE